MAQVREEAGWPAAPAPAPSRPPGEGGKLGFYARAATTPSPPRPVLPRPAPPRRASSLAPCPCAAMAVAGLTDASFLRFGGRGGAGASFDKL